MQNAVPSQEELLVHYLLQIAVVVAIARLGGTAARLVRQPRAVGEIVAGLLMGPSLFGAAAPESFHWLFRSVDPAPITIMSQIGLIMLMFQVGMQFEFGLLKQPANRRTMLAVAALSVSLPFMLGVGFGWISQYELAPDAHPWAYRLFLGVALAITAVPILGRILMDFGLTKSRIGVVAIAAAALNDAVGWVLLAMVAAFSTQQFQFGDFLGRIGGLLGYVGFSWTVTRRLLRVFVRSLDGAEAAVPHDLLAALLVLVFLSAVVTSQLGIFAIFGGFLLGVLLHDQAALASAWNNKVSDLVTVLLLPIFFTYTGLRTDVGSLNSPELWGWCAALSALAVLGKFGGAYIAGRACGLPRGESRVLGVLMNTRALMELVVANLGRDLGVIPPEVFTMLVLMAIVTTLMTAPGLRLWLPRAFRTPLTSDPQP